MKPATQPLPLHAVRALAIHAQGLNRPLADDHPPSADAIAGTVAQVSCVQIDTLHVVERSQRLALWSRLGCYEKGDLERLIYDPEDRRLFEGWLHAASIVPMQDFRYHLPHMRRRRDEPSKHSRAWLAKTDNVRMLETVLERVRREGPLRAADFEHDGTKRGSWWDWKPAKSALELLFAWGDLMIADRVNFQRCYDLRERVLPEWVDVTEPSLEEAQRHFVTQAVRTFGICHPGQAADHAYSKRNVAKSTVRALVEDGTLVEVEAEVHDGRQATLVMHRDDLPLVERATDGDLEPRRTTFLSPFDSLFWPRGRDEELWGFRQILEAYKPAAKREWGYFCLPILHRDRPVGRFDPKVDRKTGVLHLRALYLEPGVKPGERLVADVAEAMRDFMAFHDARELAIERSEPKAIARKLLSAL